LHERIDLVVICDCLRWPVRAPGPSKDIDTILMILQRVPFNRDVHHIMYSMYRGIERDGLCAKSATDHYPARVPLQCVLSNPCHDVVFCTFIPAANEADARSSVVRHCIVLDADLQGVLFCFTDAPKHVNAYGGILSDRVPSDGQVSEAVVDA